MILEINDLSVRFTAGHRVQAVENVSLSVEKRDKVAIVGETGSGKSILLLAALRLLGPEAEVSGEVLFEGKDLLKLSRKELDRIRGARISYVPQGSGNGMNPLYSVGFQVGEPMCEHEGLNRKQAFGRAVELMKQFRLGNEARVARQYPHTYSGGMRQRALIAMGIGAGAEMILADEPTKGLDERRVKLVAECFQMLSDRTILCVTHDLNFAGSISEHICVMYAASQVEYAETEELLRHPLHPYTRDMLAAMPENGLHFTEGFAISHDNYGSAGCKYAKRCRDCFERCRETPPLIDLDGHKVRCWKYAENRQGRKTEKNGAPGTEDRKHEDTDRGSDKTV